MENQNVEFYEEGSIVEFTDEQGSIMKFEELAGVELDGKFYELLTPAEKYEGIDMDEVIICEYVGDEESGDLIVVTDEAVADRVFTEYVKAAECGCDCGCEDCADDCCSDEGCGCHHHHDDDDGEN